MFSRQFIWHRQSRQYHEGVEHFYVLSVIVVCVVVAPSRVFNWISGLAPYLLVILVRNFQLSPV